MDAFVPFCRNRVGFMRYRAGAATRTAACRRTCRAARYASGAATGHAAPNAPSSSPSAASRSERAFRRP